MLTRWIKSNVCFSPKHAIIIEIEPPRRVDDEDSQTKKIIVFLENFLLHRSPYDF